MARANQLWGLVQTWLEELDDSLSEEQLATTIGVEPSAFHDWKSGRTGPPPTTLRKLADVMEPTFGPNAYTALVLAVTVDLGLGFWDVEDTRKPLPAGLRIIYLEGRDADWHARVADDT